MGLELKSACTQSNAVNPQYFSYRHAHQNVVLMSSSHGASQTIKSLNITMNNETIITCSLQRVGGGHKHILLRTPNTNYSPKTRTKSN